MQRSEPTSAVPGSAEKIEVFIRRAESGLPLFHKFDRTDCSGVKYLPVTKAERRAAISERLPIRLLPSRKNLSE